MVPSSSATSTSTVGLPRESRISRAPTASMVATEFSIGCGTGVRDEATRPRCAHRRPTRVLDASLTGTRRACTSGGEASVGDGEGGAEAGVAAHQGDVGVSERPPDSSTMRPRRNGVMSLPEIPRSPHSARAWSMRLSIWSRGRSRPRPGPGWPWRWRRRGRGRIARDQGREPPRGCRPAAGRHVAGAREERGNSSVP